MSLNFSDKKEEETVYDEVKVKNELIEQTDDTKGKLYTKKHVQIIQVFLQ